jgi:hypothetical protein
VPAVKREKYACPCPCPCSGLEDLDADIDGDAEDDEVDLLADVVLDADGALYLLFGVVFS